MKENKILLLGARISTSKETFMILIFQFQLDSKRRFFRLIVRALYRLVQISME